MCALRIAAHVLPRSTSARPANAACGGAASIASARRARHAASFHSGDADSSARSRFSAPSPLGETSLKVRASSGSGGGVHLRGRQRRV
jgi:hypothetical protein